MNPQKTVDEGFKQLSDNEEKGGGAVKFRKVRK